MYYVIKNTHQPKPAKGKVVSPIVSYFQKSLCKGVHMYVSTPQEAKQYSTAALARIGMQKIGKANNIRYSIEWFV